MKVQVFKQEGRYVIPALDLYETALERFYVELDAETEKQLKRKNKDDILHELPRFNTESGEKYGEFKRLTDALFGENYRYRPDQSDEDILTEELLKKYE